MRSVLRISTFLSVFFLGLAPFQMASATNPCDSPPLDCQNGISRLQFRYIRKSASVAQKSDRGWQWGCVLLPLHQSLTAIRNLDSRAEEAEGNRVNMGGNDEFQSAANESYSQASQEAKDKFCLELNAAHVAATNDLGKAGQCTNLRSQFPTMQKNVELEFDALDLAAGTFSCQQRLSRGVAAGQAIYLSAVGEKAITLSTMLNPFGGAKRMAEKLASQELLRQCKDQYAGRLQGGVQLQTIRMDEGCMCAQVRASGVCLVGR